MFGRFTGLFKEWHCKSCNTILKRKDIKYKTEFCGYYTRYWFMCLKCGSHDDVTTLKQRQKQIILEIFSIDER